MIDTHCHLTSKEYAGRVEAILAEAARDGVRGAVTIATTSRDSADSLALARAHPSVRCSAGVHPLNCEEPIDWELLRGCGADPRCVAWGELGLDRHYERPAQTVQLAVLEEQLARI